jgi:membrane-bound ClpP family serine protease
MEGTLRLIAWMERHAGAWGAAGAVLLFAFWNALARDVALPSPVHTTLQLATTVLITVGVVGHQLEQGTHPASWVGWAGAAAVGMGFWGSLLVACAGLLLFGIAIVRCKVHRPTSGVFLATGAGLLLVSSSLAPGFGSDNSVPMPLAWLLLMNAGLVLITKAMVDLALATAAKQETSPAA